MFFCINLILSTTYFTDIIIKKYNTKDKYYLNGFLEYYGNLRHITYETLRDPEYLKQNSTDKTIFDYFNLIFNNKYNQILDFQMITSFLNNINDDPVLIFKVNDVNDKLKIDCLRYGKHTKFWYSNYYMYLKVKNNPNINKKSDILVKK